MIQAQQLYSLKICVISALDFAKLLLLPFINIIIIIVIITPHAQRAWGKVIGCGVHIYICLWTKKIFESYFRDRLTFSNIRSRTSRRIYRLALPLRAPETLSSLSKSRISVFNVYLTLFVRRMMSHNSIGKYRHLVN